MSFELLSIDTFLKNSGLDRYNHLYVEHKTVTITNEVDLARNENISCKIEDSINREIENRIEMDRREGDVSRIYQIVDARTKEEYISGHIYHAIHMEWEAFCEKPPPNAPKNLSEPGYWGKLLSSASNELIDTLNSSGLVTDIPIVVYANSIHSKGRDGRIAWMLLYLGAKRVYILDGGVQSYINAGLTLSRELIVKKLSPYPTFIVQIKSERRIEIEEIIKIYSLKSSEMISVDTRTDCEFIGESYPYQPRKGRIPNSTLVPFSNLYHSDGTFITKDDFINLVSDRIYPDFAYCEVGVRVCTYCLLYELYCGKIIPVYDGSFMEWSFYSDLPILTMHSQ